MSDHAKELLCEGVCVCVSTLMHLPSVHSVLHIVFNPLPSDDARLFGFVRITTGDAMSKRAKFTLITWIGENISGLQRAKISTDKTLVKDVVQVRGSVVKIALFESETVMIHWGKLAGSSAVLQQDAE